ncbi:MAG: sulfotransferase [bacterium]|nr:sulfotransferase [bacterium]
MTTGRTMGQPPASDVRELFITGMPRSGTTLLERVMCLHDDVLVFGQPLPLVYVELKRRFLRESDKCSPLEERLPINDSFASTYVDPAAFARYLEERSMDFDWLSGVFNSMADFDGWRTRPSQDDGSLWDSLSRAATRNLSSYLGFTLRTLAGSERPRYLGCKEVRCEEFVPYLLSTNRKVLLMIREPRDVVVSMNRGRGREFTGPPRPLLFDLRQWRKCCAFALAYEHDPNLLIVRYEDLVSEPVAQAQRISDFLGLEAFRRASLESELRSPDGEPWDANSSHWAASVISDRSVGSYESLLGREEARFAEALCLPELKAFGYRTTLTDAVEIEEALAEFHEIGPLERPELAFYRWSTDRLDEERRRWNLLRRGSFEPGFFLFERSFKRLRRCVDMAS